MKRTIFIFSILLISCLAESQTISFLDTSKAWSVHYIDNGLKNSYYLKFDGDTIILDAIAYAKCTRFDSLSGYMSYLFREDGNGHIYARIGNGDSLVYNFKLNIGDTVKVTDVIYNEDWRLVLDSITTVNIYNVQRKKWCLHEIESPLHIKNEWFEGIGSTYGLLQSGMGLMFDYLSELSCYYENNALKYMSSYVSTCYNPGTGISENIFENNVLIFPNPSTNHLTVEDPQFTKGEIEIMDAMGRTIFISFITPKPEIDISSFPQGVYFLKISSEGRSVVKKFVKI
jgi:hypothetical protein